MRSIMLAIAIAAVPLISVAANTTAKVEQGVVAGNKGRWTHRLQGHSLRGSARGRSALACSATRGQVGGRAPRRQVRAGMRAGRLRPRWRQGSRDERGLPLSESSGRRRSRPPRAFRCWSGSMAADLPAAPPRFRPTAERFWRRRAWCWSASPTAWDRSAFWRIRS